MKTLAFSSRANLTQLEKLLTGNLEDLGYKISSSEIDFDRDITTDEWEIIKVCLKLAEI